METIKLTEMRETIKERVSKEAMQLIDEFIDRFVETHNLSKVERFQRVTGQPMIPACETPAPELAINRIKMIVEEVYELVYAQHSEVRESIAEFIRSKNKELLYHIIDNADSPPNIYSVLETLDALIDIRYVLDGAILAFGLGAQFAVGFEIVHENNMTKIPTDPEVAEKTLEKYNAMGIVVGFDKRRVDGIAYYPCIVVESSDNNYPKGKLVKPIGYRKVSLAKALE